MTMAMQRPTRDLQDLMAADQRGELSEAERAYLSSPGVVEQYRALINTVIDTTARRLREFRAEEEARKGTLPTATSEEKAAFSLWRSKMLRERVGLIDLKAWADKRSRELKTFADSRMKRLERENAGMKTYLRGLLKEQLSYPESERDNQWIAELSMLLLEYDEDET